MSATDGHDAYERGLHELGDGCLAYLQPDGSWGWSNAGLVVGDGASLLVDTLFDLPLTRRMLDAMTPHDRRIVHMVLKERTDVVTRSEGEEPRRRIIVEPAD